jgi:dUTP pyrophosphatase
MFARLIHLDATLPSKATPEAAGFDLHATKDCEILPQEIKKIPTGVCIELPKGCCGKIFDRSSIALQQIITLGGIIDSDFRGELIVILHNLSKKPFSVKKHERIAQLVCFPYIDCKIRQTCDLTPTTRGTKAFGSSGK